MTCRVEYAPKLSSPMCESWSHGVIPFPKTIFHMTRAQSTVWNTQDINYISFFKLKDTLSFFEYCFGIFLWIRHIPEIYFLVLWSTRFHSWIYIWIVTNCLQFLQNNLESFELNIIHMKIIVNLYLEAAVPYK